MDPVSCWARLCEALYDGDVEDAFYAAEDLRTWQRKGGFLPEAIPASVRELGALHHLMCVLQDVMATAEGGDA